MIGVNTLGLVESIEKLLDENDIKIIKFKKEYSKFTVVIHTVEKYPREYTFEYITDFALLRVKEGQDNIEICLFDKPYVRDKVLTIFKNIGNIAIGNIDLD